MSENTESSIKLKFNVKLNNIIVPNIPLILKDMSTDEFFTGTSDEEGICEIEILTQNEEYSLEIGNKYYWSEQKTINVTDSVREFDINLIKVPIAEVNVIVKYGDKLITDFPITLIREDNGEKFQGVTDENGECVIEVYNSLDVEFGVNDNLDYLKTNYLIEISSTEYDTNQNVYRISDSNNRLFLQLIKLDDCKNQILTNKNCKYFLHEPYMTPNNYDIYFNQALIPVNVIKEAPQDLLKRLQRTMPLTKILHLNLETEQNPQSNQINLHTKLKLKFNTPDESILQSRLQITGIWKETQEQLLKSNVSFEVYYLQDTETPLTNAKIRLVNIHYPSIQYSNITDNLGKCEFTELPYGTYVQQIILDGYKLQPTIIEITQSEQQDKILIGSTLENVPPSINIYINGILTYSFGIYENGKLSSTTSEVGYVDGKLEIETTTVEDDDSLTILLDSPDYQAITDFTEFDVEIIDEKVKV